MWQFVSSSPPHHHRATNIFIYLLGQARNTSQSDQVTHAQEERARHREEREFDISKGAGFGGKWVCRCSDFRGQLLILGKASGGWALWEIRGIFSGKKKFF